VRNIRPICADRRGLAESTIANCMHYMERFMAFRFGDKLGAYSPAALTSG
jgi:hypothetical protein